MQMNDIDKTKQDKGLEITEKVINTACGAIPFVGTAISEFITYFIPDNRRERIVSYIKELAGVVEQQGYKLNELQSYIDKLKTNKMAALLFETTLLKSMETESQIKYHCYAYFVFKTLENKILEDSRNEKLLQTLSELTEEEIIHLINFSQSATLFNSSDFDDKYEEIIMPKSQTDHIPENDIHNAFRDQYILTLEQKSLITIALKYNGTKLPISHNDVNITDYGSLLVDAIYDEDFFGKINKGE